MFIYHVQLDLNLLSNSEVMWRGIKEKLHCGVCLAAPRLTLAGSVCRGGEQRQPAADADDQ